MAKLIVALGNPGQEYEKTRHNIAWQCLESLDFYDSLNFKNKFKGVYAQKSVDGEMVYFLKPLTYMNLSGESVLPLMKFFKLTIDQILVIQDELDLPFGTLMFKDGGGLAGHNGLKSIAKILSNQAFKRLRLGIGRPNHGSVSSWVLSTYSSDQKIALDQYLEAAAAAVKSFITEDFAVSNRTFNKKSFI